MNNKLLLISSVAVLAGYTCTAKAPATGSSAKDGEKKTAGVPSQNKSDNGSSNLNLLAPGHGSHGKGKQPLGNAFSGDIISLNIGLISGIGNIYTESSLSYLYPATLSNSPSPAFGIGYEHALSHAIGVGLNIGYQSATTNFTTLGWSYSPATGAISTYTNTYRYGLSMPTFMLRGAFHFTAGTKIDPYAGLNLGYCLVSTSQSTNTNDPNYKTPTDNNVLYSTPVSLSGIAYGVFVGGRYFFTDKFGAWLEIRYSNVTLSSFNLNVNINPETWVNVGVCVKL